MAETKKDQRRREENESETPNFTISWIRSGDTPAIGLDLGLDNPKPVDLSELDIFITQRSVDMFDNTKALNALRESFERGEITRDAFVEKMDDMDHQNRSSGKGILFDGRKKKDRRIEEFADWAVTQGIDREVARNYGAVEIAKYEADPKNKKKNKKKKGWGQFMVTEDIRTQAK